MIAYPVGRVLSWITLLAAASGAAHAATVEATGPSPSVQSINRLYPSGSPATGDKLGLIPFTAEAGGAVTTYTQIVGSCTAANTLGKLSVMTRAGSSLTTITEVTSSGLKLNQGAYTGSGNGLTNLNAGNLATGMVSLARGGTNSSNIYGTANSWTAPQLFTATPAGTGAGQGSVYVNPASSTADYTLLGVAVNNNQKLQVDAEGDASLAGDLAVNGGDFSVTGSFGSAPTFSSAAKKLQIKTVQESSGSYIGWSDLVANADDGGCPSVMRLWAKRWYSNPQVIMELQNRYSPNYRYINAMGGAVTMMETPQGSTAGNAVINVNPASATSSYLLLGAAVNNAPKMKLDAKGDLFALAGTSSDASPNWASVGGTLYVSTTAGPNNGTNEYNLAVYPMPPYTMASNGDTIEIEAAGTFSNTTNPKTINLYFGTQVISTNTLPGGGSGWSGYLLKGKVFRLNSTSQISYCNTNTGIAITTGLTATLESGSTTLKITGQCADGSSQIINSIFKVNWESSGS